MYKKDQKSNVEEKKKKIQTKFKHLPYHLTI